MTDFTAARLTTTAPAADPPDIPPDPTAQMARIWDTERTVIVDRSEYEALLQRCEDAEFRYREEYKIVARIWKQLGSPTYEQLAGRSIYDLIEELKSRASASERATEGSAKP